LLEKKVVEGAVFEPLTFCLASNDANHYTREVRWWIWAKILVLICDRILVRWSRPPRVRCCVFIYFWSVCKAEWFELQIVIRKIPYNTLITRYPCECLGMHVMILPFPLACCNACNLKGQHSLAALVSYPLLLHAF